MDLGSEIYTSYLPFIGIIFSAFFPAQISESYLPNWGSVGGATDRVLVTITQQTTSTNLNLLHNNRRLFRFNCYALLVLQGSWLALDRRHMVYNLRWTLKRPYDDWCCDFGGTTRWSSLRYWVPSLSLAGYPIQRSVLLFVHRARPLRIWGSARLCSCWR